MFNLNLLPDDVFEYFNTPAIISLLSAIVKAPLEKPDPLLFEPFRDLEKSSTKYICLYLRVYSCDPGDFDDVVDHISKKRGGDILWAHPIRNLKSQTSNDIFYAGITSANTPEGRMFDDKCGG